MRKLSGQHSGSSSGTAFKLNKIGSNGIKGKLCTMNAPKQWNELPQKVAKALLSPDFLDSGG